MERSLHTSLDARVHLGAGLALGLLLLAAAPAGAMTILAEQRFNGDGTGLGFTTVGGGVNSSDPNDFWGLASSSPVSLGFTGQEGSDFFGGRDLDSDLDGNGDVNPRILRMSAVDVSAFAGDVAVRMLLAATPDSFELFQADFLRIYAVNDDDPTQRVQLDVMRGLGFSNASLFSFGTGRFVGSEFAEFSYDLPIGIDRVRIEIEAHSNAQNEAFAIDWLQVFRKSPEPSTALLVGGGLWAMAAGRRQQRAALRQQRAARRATSARA